MATIIARKRSDGTTGYTARIRIKQNGKTVYQAAKTFDRAALAKAWAARHEAEMSTPGALERLASRITFGDLIRRCIATMETVRPLGRTRRLSLLFLCNTALADMDCTHITAPVIIEYCRSRKQQGASAATVNIDIAYIRSILKMGRAVFGLDLNLQAVQDATLQLRSLGWIAQSRKRARRPTETELDALREFFKNSPRHKVPMVDIIDFAIASCRRQEEITRIKWSLINSDERTAVIEDIKHPTRKIGNHRKFKLLQAAWDIVQRQPRTSDYVFPYTRVAISANFTRACKKLGIQDLHFHDLRHHGVSLLFEKGYSIQEVQLISLHENWTTLNRYTHLKPEDLREK